MKSTSFQRSRDLVTLLRERVVTGRYAPGQQLPARAALVSELDSSTNTVQAALDVLVNEGFLRSERRIGTFVASHPPHLHDYAMVTVESVEHLSQSDASRYPRLLMETAKAMPADESRRFKIYDGVDSRTLDESFHRLRSDLFHRRLAGVIKTCRYHARGLIEESKVPWVLMDAFVNSDTIFSLVRSRRIWMTAAGEHLRKLGRRRVAIIGNATTPIAFHHTLATILREQGLTVLSEHIQSAHPQASAWARSATTLLLSLPEATRPDAILVTDDVLTDPVLCGVLDRSLRTPTDLEIVSLANFPSPAPTILPVTRLGWDMRQELLTATDMIRRFNAGTLKPCAVHAPLYFESQIPAVPVSALSSESNFVSPHEQSQLMAWV